MEGYKVIKGFEQYQISTKGRVIKCLPMIDNKIPYKVIKQFTDKSGYKCFSLYKDNKYTVLRTHIAVGKTFVSADITRFKHADGNKANNCVSNLVW